MNAKSTIRKVLFIGIWVCIGAGMLTLLLAAISKKNKGECKDYAVTIKGAENNFFIDKDDVVQMLKKETKSEIKGLAVASFNLHQLEQMLEKNTWVSKAEIYFDNRDVLHVTVTEKEPVARIFTNTSTTFYIDSAGKKMPLSDKLSARVPVFTGYPDKKLMTPRDSVLLNDVRVTANFIINDPFWMAQVAQIDITPERTFEMIPVVGNHIVRLGNGDNIEKKFHRLMVFYQQVLSKTGFEKYKIIDVQYEGQVVASKTGTEKTDTALLRKNVEKLMKQSRDAQNDTVMRSVPVAGRYQIDVDSTIVSEGPLEMDDKPKPNNDKPAPVKQDNPKPNDSREPRAVMPKRN